MEWNPVNFVSSALNRLAPALALCLFCVPLSPVIHAAVDIAPQFDANGWSYDLCDDTTDTSIMRSIAHCTAFEAGLWQGKFSPCAKATPVTQDNAIQRAEAFTKGIDKACDKLQTKWHGWLGPGESIGANWCQSGEPIYENGVEVYNVSRIDVNGFAKSAHGACDTARPIGERIVFTRRRAAPQKRCPEGYRLNGVVCSLDGVNPHKNNQSCPDNGSNPVHTALGSKLQREADYLGPGRHPLRFVRRYSSADHWERSALGRHWRHHYDRHIALTETPELRTATAYREDGSRYYFSLIDGQWTPDADVTARLESISDAQGQHTGWRYLRADDTLEHYDAQGKLISITQRGGLHQTLSYDLSIDQGGDGDASTLDRITGPFGRSLALAYDARGRLSMLRDPAGQRYRYDYDAHGNLSAVSYPDASPNLGSAAPTRRYHYEDARFVHALTGISDERGERVARWDYDDQGRAISSQHGTGADQVSLSYNDDGTTTVSNALGQVQSYHFELIEGVLKTRRIDGGPCSNCGGQFERIDYDEKGLIRSRTDFNGYVTEFEYNQRGLQTRRTEALGTAEARSITTAWHPQYRLAVSITEPGKTIAMNYDAQGRLLERIETDPQSGAIRTWGYQYSAQGLLTQVDGPRTDVSDLSHYEYDAQGNLVGITNALGQRTQISEHDAHGRVLRLTDPNGLSTSLAYDARGRLISRTAGEATTVFEYDAGGRLRRLTLPSGVFIDYRYDAAHRLTGASDALGNRIEYTLDALGNHLSEAVYDRTHTLRRTQSQVFDALGRLLEVHGAAGQISGYAYDANGNPISVTDALSRTTTSAFDALNRRIASIDPLGAQTHYRYDAQDRLRRVTDPRGLTTRYSYDGLGNLLQQHSPDTGTTLYSYDAAGNRLTQTDARGISARFDYDVLNRLIAVHYPERRHIVRYRYDQGRNGIGRLSAMHDDSGVSRYEYDDRGNLITQTQGIGGIRHRIQYRYDVDDRLIQIRYPSGLRLDYSYNGAGQISALSSITEAGAETLVQEIEYQPFGALSAMRYGNGLQAAYDYDLDGRLSTLQLGEALHLGYRYDALGNITAIDNSLDATHSQRFGYDALDRLIHDAGVYGQHDYRYDALGNRTQHLSTVAHPRRRTILTRTQHYRYAEQSNRLIGIDDKPLRYDPAGHLISDRSAQHRFGYNDAGRLSRFSGPRAATVSYVHNGKGQRVIKQTQDNKRHTRNHYHYAPDGRLLAESRYSRRGKLKTQVEYLWLENIPIAQIRSQYRSNGSIKSRQRIYLHSDHLHTPRLATDARQRIVWRWDSGAFGQSQADTDPDGDGKEINVNLRFAGQYYDPESGLHYNYFRDYDPKIGRYVQSDPIGLDGGMNTYTYVGSNPLLNADPRGLCIWKGRQYSANFIIAIGAAIGYFELVSECLNNRRASIEVLAVGPGIGISAGYSLAINGSSSSVEFDDFQGSHDVNPSAFEGPFVAYNAGASLAPYGAGVSFVNLGHARNTSYVGVGLDSGVGIGASVVTGTSTVTSVAYENCDC